MKILLIVLGACEIDEKGVAGVPIMKAEGFTQVSLSSAGVVLRLEVGIQEARLVVQPFGDPPISFPTEKPQCLTPPPPP
jgi:hypothetical protein